MAVILGVLLDATQCCQRLFVLLAIELQLRLRQQHRICCFGSLLVSQFEPLVTALVLALQVRRTCGLQVIEEWRIARARSPGQEFFTACEIAFGDLDHAACEFQASACRTIAACGLAQPFRRLDQAAYQPDREQEKNGEAQQDRDRHFNEVAAEIDRNIARIAKQEMCRERTQYHRDDNNGREFHCADSLMLLNWRSSRSDSEISGGAIANRPLRISANVAFAPRTCALSASKYRSSQ